MSRLYVIVVFGFAEVGRHLSALTRRNAGRDALHFESGAILIAIVALASDHRCTGAIGLRLGTGFSPRCSRTSVCRRLAYSWQSQSEAMTAIVSETPSHRVAEQL